MATSEVTYLGNLRTSNKHLTSGSVILTDAPTDNQGEGLHFSPTDLLSTSLAACMITIMGITARNKNIELGEVEASVTKEMTSNPRRVTTIQIHLKFPDKKYTPQEQDTLKLAAIHCPVAKSLHPDIIQDLKFEFTL